MSTFADMLRAEIQATHEYAVDTHWWRALTWERIPDTQCVMAVAVADVTAAPTPAHRCGLLVRRLLVVADYRGSTASGS